jgi:signal peptidase S26 family
VGCQNEFETLIPDTPVYPTDSHGRVQTVRMPEGWFIVPDGQVFVLSNHHPRSWDSRYFGCLPLSAVRGTVRVKSSRSCKQVRQQTQRFAGGEGW